jgi:hypothetical protein
MQRLKADAGITSLNGLSQSQIVHKLWYYSLENVEQVIFTDRHSVQRMGYLAQMQSIPTEMCLEPDIDVAALVAKVDLEGDLGKAESNVFYWNERFWMRAFTIAPVGKHGIAYYKNHRYLLYEVGVDDHKKVLGSLVS